MSFNEEREFMKMNSKILKSLSLVSQLGLMMAVPIFLCMLLGIFLDNVFGTKVVFLIIFTILGVLSAFRNLFVFGLKMGKKDDDKRG